MNIPEQIVLVLSGGNALGAYQAGAYQALHERGIEPVLVVGASIGAVNGAIIAGNAHRDRIGQLQAFWRLAEQSGFNYGGSLPEKRWAAIQTVLAGRPGLFAPRIPGLWSALPGVPNDVSLFDTRPALGTIERCIDFDRLNKSDPAFVATAVDVESGEDVAFDSRAETLTAEHVLASTAFPVAYPPVEIGGRTFVDAGLSANLPLAAALANPSTGATLCIAVDLFALPGNAPRSLGDAALRMQDLAFAKQSQHQIKALGERHGLPSAQNQSAVTLLHVTYSGAQDESALKMVDFSASSIGQRWAAGYRDMTSSLDELSRRPEHSGVFTAFQFVRGALAAYGQAHQPPSAHAD